MDQRLRLEFARGRAMIWLVGLGPFLLVHVPITLIAASIGVWLFYLVGNCCDATVACVESFMAQDE